MTPESRTEVTAAQARDALKKLCEPLPFAAPFVSTSQVLCAFIDQAEAAMEDARRTTDFAKIVRATDGEQVLFYAGTDDENRPLLNQVTVVEGITARVDVGFADGDWERLDAAFESADVARADELRAAVRKMLSQEPQP